MLFTFYGHRAAVTAAQVTQDGKYVVSGSRDGMLIIWSIESGDEIHAIEAHDKEVNCIAVERDSVFTGSSDNTIKQWNLETGNLVRVFKGHQGPVYALCVSSDKKLVISGGDDRKIIFWDMNTGAKTRVVNTKHFDRISAMVIDHNRNMLVSAGGLGKKIDQRSIETGELLRTIKDAHVHRIPSMALTPDGKMLVSVSWDQTLKIWEMESGALILVADRPTPPSRLYAVSVTPDGKYAITGGSGVGDGVVRKWDLKTGKLIQTYRGHKDWVACLAVSADGKRMVSGSDDGTLNVWNLD